MNPILDNNQICPWGSLHPATIAFCEERLCAWITEPANAWSNIGYLLVGIYVLRCARREGQGHLAVIGWIAIAVSFGSTWFHATSTFAGEVIDLSSMFFFANYFLAANFRRLYPTMERQVARLVFWVLTVVAVAALLWDNPSGIRIFAGLVTAIVLLEMRLAYVETLPANRKYLWLLILAFVLAYVAWNLDFHHIVCDSRNHFFQGHSFWHLSNSLCFYFLFRFFAQFKMLER